MTTFLWITQSRLALMFMMGGGMKVFKSKLKLLEFSPGFASMPIVGPKLVGVLEILGAVGIIAPSLTNIYPQLTNAAVCLALTLIGAAIYHIKRNEYKTLPFIILLFVLPSGSSFKIKRFLIACTV